MRGIAVSFCLALAAFTSGCATRHVAAPVEVQQAIRPSYIDLEPGWRLRVVTPILKSGGYRIKTAESVEGATVSLKVGDDFQGFELAYYAVKSHGGPQFVSAEITRNGEKTAQTQPLLDLFQLPHSVRHVRLMYLTRVSHADHDMAVVAAREMPALAAMTQRVEADPANACRDGEGAYCSWIPAGIAVTPELREKGGSGWAPAR